MKDPVKTLAINWPLSFPALQALLYELAGQHLPGKLGHSDTPLYRFLGTQTIAEGGIRGGLTDTSVGVVAIFVIFGGRFIG